MTILRTLLLALLIAPLAAPDAHPGRLNSAGCHKAKRHGYHCHRVQKPSKPPTKPKAPPPPKRYQPGDKWP